MNNQAFELIPLKVETRGEVIASNVEEVREMVRAALSNINRDLTTDDEFGQAELDVKSLKGVEERFAEAKAKALKDAEALHELFAKIDATVEEVRKPRLELEKLIARRKDEIKAEIIAEAMAKLDCAERLKKSVFGTSVADSIKGKRTLESMAKALHVTVSVHNAEIGKNRERIVSFEKAHGTDMTMDKDELEVKSPDSVEAELRRRFEAKKAADERKRLEAEAAKAKAELEAVKAPAKVDPRNPHNLPPPPKIGSIPVAANVVPFNAPSANAEMTADAEWDAFKSAVLTSFGPLKAAKASLKHPQNVERASAFAQAVNAAWNAMKRMEVAS